MQNFYKNYSSNVINEYFFKHPHVSSHCTYFTIPRNDDKERFLVHLSRIVISVVRKRNDSY